MTAGNAALYAYESEAALIGAAMYSPTDCEVAFDQLRPEHFGDGVHAMVWAAITEVYRSGGSPSPPIVRDRVGDHPAFVEWGGGALLADLWDVATVVGVSDHVGAVADRAARRAAKRLIEGLLPRFADVGDARASDLLNELERGAVEISRDGPSIDNWVGASSMVREALDHAKSHRGVIDFPFGIPAVDGFVGGLNAGELTLLAARPGMGKSVGAQAIARANASQGVGVCFFSLEMTRRAMGMRLATDLTYDRQAPYYSGLTSCPTADKALKGELSPAQWRELDEAERRVERWPLLTDDRSGLTMAQIEAAARRQIRAWENAGIRPGPIIIDHLGKVRPSKERNGSKHAEMADVSSDAQLMAKRLGVPVVGLVQLNRGVEGRDDKRPMLSDLRQAGELEEDARQVIFLYRPEYYVRDGLEGETQEQRLTRLDKLQACEHQLYWIVEKNSHGPRGQVLTFCEIACSAIREWSPNA